MCSDYLLFPRLWYNVGIRQSVEMMNLPNRLAPAPPGDESNKHETK
jgi:hypothetical protein